MRIILLSAIAVALMVTASPASAYQLKSATTGGGCTKDAECDVYCDNGQQAGSMTWNGSVWTDGERWDPDMNVVARQICKANGTACT